MRLANYSAAIVAAIIDHKKVGRVPENLEKRTEEFCIQLDALNNLKRDAKRFGDDLLSETEVAGIFKPFIAPNSVTVSGAEEDFDFLEREETQLKAEDRWDAEEFHAYATFINGILKRDDYATISESRTDVVITGDNKHNFCDGDNASSKVAKGIIPFNLVTRVLKDDRYLESTDKIIRRVIEHMAD